MKKVVILFGGLVLLVGFCLGFYFLGDKHAVESMSFKRVTPEQIATAMKDDHFYSSYRENTLIVSGEVLSLTQSDRINQVTFKTDSSFKAYCNLASDAKVPKVGDDITILSEGGAALRQPDGVLLVNCTTL